ncbi:hypothetical protein ABFY09_01810 [Marinomonas sp. 5E14-1]
MANHPALVAVMYEGALQYCVGGGVSHLVCGHLKPHQQLEEVLVD